MGDRGTRIDSGNARTGVVFGALSTLPLVLLFTRPFSARGSALQQIVCAVGGVCYVGAGALLGAWAARSTGRRRAGPGAGGRFFGALAGAGAAWALLGLLAPLAWATEIDAVALAQKTGGDLLRSAVALMFFGFLPATFAGAIGGLVLSLLVKPEPLDARAE